MFFCVGEGQSCHDCRLPPAIHNAYNDLLQKIIYINSHEEFTIALGLSQFKGSLGTDWSKIMSATCMSFIPGIIFYLVGQRYFIEGIVMTGMKG